MADKRLLQRYRQAYAALLRLYPRPFRERFGESMEQTFADLLADHVTRAESLFAFALWILFDTFTAVIREYRSMMMTQNRAIARIAGATLLLLLVPLIAMQFTDEVRWGPLDFLIAGGLLFAAGITYELVAKRAKTTAYRAGVGLAAATALFLIWVNLAVGVIGNEENPANLMYLGVLALPIAGAFLTGVRPKGMERVLLATAAAQMGVALIAHVAGFGVTYILNGLFALLWLGSALFFRHASASEVQSS